MYLYKLVNYKLYIILILIIYIYIYILEYVCMLLEYVCFSIYLFVFPLSFFCQYHNNIYIYIYIYIPSRDTTCIVDNSRYPTGLSISY